ncbi:MAG: efflux transporter outer membrane subunit [Bryobacterales bacterium]|nr:efflux transporter outer membrane subunit [Bryobacterales bacterium]
MKRILVFSLAGLLCGCGVGPKYQRPQVQIPAPASSNSNSFGDLRWFEVFQDETLIGLIRTATSDNFDVLIAANRILQAGEEVRIARGQLLPQADVGFAPQRGINNLNVLIQGERARPATTYTLNFGASWEIDLWGKLRSQTQAARANFLAAKENRDVVVQFLVTTLAQSYIGLRELDNELEIAKGNLQTVQESLELTQIREAGGVSSLVEVKQADSLVQTAKRSIPVIEQQIVIQENSINFLLGRNPGKVPRGQTLQQQNLSPLLPEGLPSSLIERRPDIRFAEQQLIAANAQIGVAKAALFPTIGLTGSGGSISSALQDLFANGTEFWLVGGSLIQPIFAGGRLRANYRLSKLQKEQLVLQYAKACQQAFREVADALVSVEKTREARIHQEALTKTLADQQQLSWARYQGGVTAFLEVLDTQRQYFSAQQALSQAQRDELLAVIALYKALGGGWQQ